MFDILRNSPASPQIVWPTSGDNPWSSGWLAGNVKLRNSWQWKGKQVTAQVYCSHLYLDLCTCLCIRLHAKRREEGLIILYGESYDSIGNGRWAPVHPGTGKHEALRSSADMSSECIRSVESAGARTLPIGRRIDVVFFTESVRVFLPTDTGRRTIFFWIAVILRIQNASCRFREKAVASNAAPADD